MKKFKTVFWFEYTNYIKSKSFIVMSIIFLLAAIGLGSIPAIQKGIDSIKTAFSSDDGKGDADVTLQKAAIIDVQGAYSDDLLKVWFPDYEWLRSYKETELEAAIKDSSLEIAVVIDGLSYRLYMDGSKMMGGGLPGIDELVLSTYRNATLQSHGLTEADIIALESAVLAPEIVPVGKDITQSFWLAYVILFMLYMTTILYGQYVLSSVVTEKTSKAMEVLITAAKPTELMFGKVAGTGAAGLTQFGVLMLAAVATIQLNLDGWTASNPIVAGIMSMSLSGGIFLYAILFFLIGFFTFAFLNAAVGSTVSQVGDASAVSGIPTLLFVAAFIAAMAGMASPDAEWVRICSYVPFVSPLVVFMRICVSTQMAVWEVWVGIALSLVYMIGTGLAASRIYRVGVLMYGKPPKMRELVRYVFMKQ